MNLKQLLALKASSGGSASKKISFSYSLSAYCSPKGGKTYTSIENGTGAYAACYSLKGSDYTVYNMMGDEITKYPIMLNGAKKLAFNVPVDYKATVFFTDSKTSGLSTYAAWVDGDNSAYDSNVPNGPREVTVPEGADSFIFSVYYKSNTLTDADMASVTVTADE